MTEGGSGAASSESEGGSHTLLFVLEEARRASQCFSGWGAGFAPQPDQRSLTQELDQREADSEAISPTSLIRRTLTPKGRFLGPVPDCLQVASVWTFTCPLSLASFQLYPFPC